MMITEFVVTILVWLFVGFLGIVFNAKQIDSPNFPMISFLIFVPFIPILAKVCRIF